MNKIVAALLLSLGFTVAFAFEVVPNSRLLITDDTGKVVGEGKIEDDEAELDLLVGFDGLATLQVTAADGSVDSYSVMVDADGSVTITEPDGFTELGPALQAGGFSVDIERDDSVGRQDDADDGRDDGDDDGGRRGDDDDGADDDDGRDDDRDDGRDDDGDDDDDDNSNRGPGNSEDDGDDNSGPGNADDDDGDDDDDDDRDGDDEDEDNSGHGGGDDDEREED